MSAANVKAFQAANDGELPATGRCKELLSKHGQGLQVDDLTRAEGFQQASRVSIRLQLA